MEKCKHQWSRKKRCGLTNPRRFYRLCDRCGLIVFGTDKSKRERLKRERL
jgi:hypothetical protein